MSMFPDVASLTVARTVIEQQLRDGHCDCRMVGGPEDQAFEVCVWHRLGALLEPTVEAAELPW